MRTPWQKRNKRMKNNTKKGYKKTDASLKWKILERKEKEKRRLKRNRNIVWKEEKLEYNRIYFINNLKSKTFIMTIGSM